MKNLFLLVSLSLIMFMTSCSKDEKELGNLPGTWRLTKVTADGNPSTGTGTINFSEGSGLLNLDFKIGSTQVGYDGDFSFTETVDNVVLQGGPTIVIDFRRVTNTSKKQVFEFIQFIDVEAHLVRLEFEKQ